MRVEKFHRFALECRQKAKLAARPVDRQAWLKLADDWDKLAQGADLHRAWQATSSAKFIRDQARGFSADEP